MALSDLSPLDLFMRMAAVPSPPGKERVVADLAIAFLGELGLETDEDDAGVAIGSDIGNIYTRLAPTADGDALFLNAHLDTVPPTDRIEPVIDDQGRVVNAHDTILGGDNKAAVAVMLCALRDLVREGRPHAGVELVLTPMEEVGLLGAKEFDTRRLRARFGYCYDHAAPIGNIVLAAPWQQSFTVAFAGRAAHSGMEPENGRSAIQAAARAIAEMPLGRIDPETTTNVGLIEGGVAGNIVPPRCVFRAEARSRDRDRLEEVSAQIIDAANRAAHTTGCEAEISLRSEYVGYRLSPSAKAVKLISSALRANDIEPAFIESGGGADANVFNAAGVTCVNVCNGMAEIHTPDEHIAVEDIDRMTGITRSLIDLSSNRS
jgi:tripeptide aminopeptidase